MLCAYGATGACAIALVLTARMCINGEGGQPGGWGGKTVGPVQQKVQTATPVP